LCCCGIDCDERTDERAPWNQRNDNVNDDDDDDDDDDAGAGLNGGGGGGSGGGGGVANESRLSEAELAQQFRHMAYVVGMNDLDLKDKLQSSSEEQKRAFLQFYTACKNDVLLKKKQK